MRPINLLPPEQAQRAKRRRGLLFGLFLFAVFLAVLGAVTFWRLSQAADAEQAVLDQQAENQAVLAQIASLSEAQELRRIYDDTATQIQDVLAVDIDWGSLLNDIGRVIPDRVWLEGLAVTRSIPALDAEGDALNVFGSISLTGQAFDYPDASIWLKTLDSAEWDAVGGAWVPSVSLGETEGIQTVSFTSSSSLTGAALSDRAIQRVPVVDE